jgi:hypothetical protein
MAQGVNKLGVFFIAPMLGGHPGDIFPRFRDCYLEERGFELNNDWSVNVPKENAKEEGIYIYTRVGGGNRYSYKEEIKKLQAHEDYIRDFDDDFDCTYATFVFKVPTKWQKDFQLIKTGKLKETSKYYQNMILETFPKIKEKLEETFK